MQHLYSLITTSFFYKKQQAERSLFAAIKHDEAWKMVQYFLLNSLLGMRLEAQSSWLHSKVWIIAP